MKGSIKKRSKGSYSIILELGADPKTGKRRQKWLTVNGTKKDAERELHRRLNEIDRGCFVDPAKLTVAEFLEHWLTNYAEVNVSGKTLERYRSIVKHHLVEAFGSLPLPRLTPLHIQQHYSDALKGGRKDGRDGGLSAQSVLHHHRLLHAALAMAVKWQLLARNPTDAVEPPKVLEKDIEAIDETRATWLMDAARGTRLFLPIVLAICAGLRRGEILALQWQDFDTGCTRLWIRRSAYSSRAQRAAAGGGPWRCPRLPLKLSKSIASSKRNIERPSAGTIRTRISSAPSRTDRFGSLLRSHPPIALY